MLLTCKQSRMSQQLSKSDGKKSRMPQQPSKGNGSQCRRLTKAGTQLKRTHKDSTI